MSATPEQPQVAFFLDFMAPYRIGAFEALGEKYPGLKIYVSALSEPNRPWPPGWRDLDVTVQKNLTFARPWRHPAGFEDEIYVQVPYDTVPSIVRTAPDVVVSFELGYRTLQALVATAVRRGSRLVVWTEVSEETEIHRSRLRRLMRRLILPRADAVLVLGESGRRYISRYGVEPDRIHVVPLTTDLDSFLDIPLERQHVAGEARRLLYLGQFTTRKGLEPFIGELVKYCATHSDASVVLRLCGGGPLENDLRSIATPANLTLDFVGVVDYEDLPEHYAWAEAMVFPTLVDAWGVVVNESLAAGVPVLGSIKAQAIDELVRHGETGWTFDPSDTAAVASAISDAMDTTGDELDAMRIRCRQAGRAVSPASVADDFARAIAAVSD